MMNRVEMMALVNGGSDANEPDGNDNPWGWAVDWVKDIWKDIIG